MKVTVVHTAFEDAPRIVAEVEAPHAKVEEALEYAYLSLIHISEPTRPY